MDHSNKLPPPFHIAFPGLYANSIQQMYQHGKNEQQSTCQGMSVQTLKSPFPGYARLKPTESSDSGEPLSLPNEVTTSVMGKTSKARYALSGERRISQSIRNAKYNAYRSAINKGFSEQVAREKGESAATAEKAELSSTSSITAQSSD